jgi:membrane-bound lytic murein transglycosylase D
LLAVAYIISNPRKFNLDICYPEQDFTWTRITLPKQVNLRLLARYAKIDLDALLKANSELELAITPPGAGYQLKVRSEDEPAVLAVLARKDIKLMEHYIYTIKKGDTLLALARYYGVSVESILRENGNLNPRRLRLGTRLLIPAIRDISKPYINKTQKQLAYDNATWKRHWTVESGETLWSIAKALGVGPSELARVNGMRMNSTLRVGVRLRVP